MNTLPELASTTPNYSIAFFFLLLLLCGVVFIWDRRCKEVKRLKGEIEILEEENGY